MSRTLRCSALLLLFASSALATDFKWIDDKSNPGYNCAGKVSDAVCCKDDFCNAAKSEADCKGGNKQFLCAWANGQCRSFRDASNNVCCQSEVKDACDKVVKGICPTDWQVPENCCSVTARKWNGTLIGVKPGFVCCNAPCTEMQKSGCPLPDKCAPSQRSLGMGRFNPITQLGFYNAQMQAQQLAFGNILPGTGFGGDYGMAILAGLGDGKSKNQQVDEVTVDDIMSMLVESLSADKDAMVYNAEMNSDPYLGKIKSGGLLAGMNLPNPNMFIDMLYGNPFGMSGGNIMGSYPSQPAFYPQSMLRLPTPSPYYPQSPYSAYPGVAPYSPPMYPPAPLYQSPYASQYPQNMYMSTPQYAQPMFSQALQYPQMSYQPAPQTSYPQAPQFPQTSYQQAPQYPQPQYQPAPPTQYQQPAQQYQTQAPQYRPS